LALLRVSFPNYFATAVLLRGLAPGFAAGQFRVLVLPRGPVASATCRWTTGCVGGRTLSFTLPGSRAAAALPQFRRTVLCAAARSRMRLAAMAT